MPEFILDHGSTEGARTFAALDAFTQGYIEAAFFTSTGNAEDDDLEDATVAELAPEALDSAIIDCVAFQVSHALLLELAYERDDYSPEQAGRDFWFTRNGHGVGFWSREQLESGAPEYEALTRAMIANRDNAEAWGAALAKRKIIEAESLGRKLTGACDAYGQVDMYRGDDGLIYFS